MVCTPSLIPTILWKDHKQPYSEQCGGEVYIYSTADYLTLICHGNRCYVWHTCVVLLGEWYCIAIVLLPKLNKRSIAKANIVNQLILIYIGWSWLHDNAQVSHGFLHAWAPRSVYVYLFLVSKEPCRSHYDVGTGDSFLWSVLFSGCFAVHAACGTEVSFRTLVVVGYECYAWLSAVNGVYDVKHDSHCSGTLILTCGCRLLMSKLLKVS